MLVAPVSDEAVPAGHDLHVYPSAPVDAASTQVPASHGTHWRNIPAAGPYVPAGQSEHTWVSSSASYRPAAQQQREGEGEEKQQKRDK